MKNEINEAVERLINRIEEAQAVQAGQDAEADRLEEEELAQTEECDCVNADELIIDMVNQIIVDALTTGEKISKSTRKNLLALNELKLTSLSVLEAQPDD